MLPLETLLLFTIASFVLALTPGPVWLYLISRTLAQGRRAGYFSMLGVTRASRCTRRSARSA